MDRTSFSEFACSAARTLDIAGEWWTPLILRDVFLGLKRFDAIQEDLGIPRKVLAARLARLVEHAVLVRLPYKDGRTRYEYDLTDKGRDFVTVLVALMNWGDVWAAPDGPPLRITHAGCGGRVKAELICNKCRVSLDAKQLRLRPGPGARARRGTALVARGTRS